MTANAACFRGIPVAVQSGLFAFITAMALSVVLSAAANAEAEVKQSAVGLERLDGAMTRHLPVVAFGKMFGSKTTTLTR